MFTQNSDYITGWTTEVPFPEEIRKGFFPLRHRVKTDSGTHPASYSRDIEAVTPGLRRPVREPDRSPPSNAEVKNAWSYALTPPYVLMVWYLIKHRDNFTFTLVISLIPSHGTQGGSIDLK
jgi:hypothetical protein